MTFSLPLILIGVLGLVLFIVTGLASFIPWVASGPFALVFLGLMVAELREYFQRPKPEPKPAPSGVYANQEPIESDADVDVSAGQRAYEDAPIIKPQSFETYTAYLSKGDLLTIEAGADDWIRVELVSLTESKKLDKGKKYDWERGKEGKNLTVEYEAKRNGNWYIYVFNLVKTSLEVGVTLTVD